MNMPLLTFEMRPDTDAVEVHFNRAGLESLIRYLRKAAQEGDIHLMTPAWGGAELSPEAQGSNSKLFNHVKMIYWE